ncbi:MAG TPA: hypothetical protein VET85_02245 [Stellaceae bacterium]|nr:hypothetical protein [Stellaceae bacterium]
MRRWLVLAGIGCLAVMVLTHVAEHWRILPGMGWGQPNSPGHYLDLSSAILGAILLLAALIWSRNSN